MRKIATAIIIVLAIILMISTFSIGATAEFYCTKHSGSTSCLKNGKKSLGGIYCAMRTHKGKWLTTKAVTGGGWADESSYDPSKDGTSTITSTGALCFGHATSSSGNKLAIVKKVIDTSATQGSYNEHLLAYWVHKATVNKDKGSNEGAKPEIRKWLHDFYDGIIQKDDTNAEDSYKTKAAKEYASSVTKSKFESSTKATGNQTITYKDGYSFIGPYNLNFAGGKITKAEIVREGKTNISLTQYSESVSTAGIKNLTSLKEYNASSFYLVYKGEVDSVKNIILTKQLEVINSRTVLTEPQDKGGQNIAIYYGEKVTSDIILDLPGVSKSSLEITKIDKETKAKLANIGFILHCKNQGYVVEGNPATYVSKKADATIFYTKADGTRKIENLPKGGTYTIYEVINKNKIYEAVSVENPKNLGTIDITLGGDFKYTAENKRNVGDLEIVKKDEETDKALSGIEFVVYCEGKGYVVDGEPATYVSDIKNAKKYPTDANGKVTVKNILRDKKYTVYEVKNPYYEYETVSITNAKNLGTVTLNANDTNGYKVTYNVTNKRIVADIEITKIDKDTKEKLSGIEFVVYCEGKGYVVEGEPATYVSDIKSAKKYPTDANGKVTVKNVLRDKTYTVYEVGNPYYIYEKVSIDNPKKIGQVTTTTDDKKNYTVSFTGENDQIVAHIEILKADKETKEKLSGIGFVAYLPGKGYVKENKNDLSTYVSSIYDATIYYSDEKDGVAKIKDLPIQGTYTIYEVDNPYYQYLEATLERPMNMGTVTVNDFATFYTVIENQPVDLAKLIITKIDEDSKKPMNGVGFVVHCPDKGGYLKDGLPATYVPDIQDATIYRTGEDGKAIVDNIRYERDYTIYEVENPNFGYEEVSLEKPKKLSTVTVVRNEEVTETFVTETNKRLYIKLSGYVWEDIISTKQSIRNNLWKNDVNDDEDKRLNNITVTLKKADGTVIDTRVTQTITNSEGKQEDGAYLFGDYQRDPNAKKILIEDLTGAYIEFEYNGMCYKSVAINLTQANGSKATDDKLRSAFNASYATISKDKAQSGNYNLKYDYKDHVSTLNYGGQYKYGYQGQKYPISGIDRQYLLIANTKDAAPNKILAQDKTINDILKEGIEEIKNINLGVAEREMPDMALVEDIDNVKISLNGYEHTYIYDQRFDNYENQIQDSNFNLTVSYGTKYGPSSYTREVYASDVSYNALSGNAGKLKIYITYKIALRNEATSVYTKVNEIINYYDERYTIVGITDEKGNEITDRNSVGTQSGYKAERIRVNQNVITQNQKYLYITYDLSNEAINSLLNGEATLNSITEITSYSSYDNEGFTNAYAGVDRDSAPENAKVEDSNTYEDDTDQAPSLILKLKEGRNVEGTVFEDGPIAELLNKSGNQRERKGNGIYENTNENVVQNVKVELLTKDASGNYMVADLNRHNGANTYTEKAERITGVNGKYIFEGVIPGNYLIRFTYGNASVIYDVNGNKVKTIDITEYKSTIFRGGSSANTELDWYATDTILYSDAKDINGIKSNGDKFDIVTDRTTSKEITYVQALKEEELQSIEANTNDFEILMEYDVNKDKISPYGEELKFIFGNIDFGITERPIQNIKVMKEIEYIELVLPNGQVAISGDPRVAGNIKYVQKLGENSHIKIEMDDELMQGSTLKVKYVIKVNTNNSEVDYNDKNYYYYGTPSNSTAYKVISVTRLLDYLSNDLRIDLDDSVNKDNWTKFEITPDMVTNGYMSQEAYEGAKKYRNILSTEAFKNMGVNEEKVVPMVVSTTLSKGDELVFENHVEANILAERKMKDAIPGNYDPVNKKPDESDDDNRVITITPNTGENRNYLPYIITVVSSLLILVLGIVILKKKLTKK